jgi:hypothetical protein
MSQRWQIDVDRVVVTGAPHGPVDEPELRAQVGSAIGERLRASELPAARRTVAAVRIDASQIPGGTRAIANSVAASIVRAAGGARRG